MNVRNIGNDEGDVYCDLCRRKDWFTALEIEYDDDSKRIVCKDRYDGESCADAMLAHLLAQGV